jgi:hypothetical protein
MARSLAIDDVRLGQPQGTILRLLREVPRTLSELSALPMWPFYSFQTERVLHWALATIGTHALPLVLAWRGRFPLEVFDVLARFDAPEVAPAMADALARLKTVRPRAQRWLGEHATVAAMGLLPVALGPAGAAASQAAGALRFIASRGRLGDLRTVADRWGSVARAGLDALLAEDPLDDVPAKAPKLPSFVDIDALPRPRVVGTGRALSTSATTHLVEMLAFTKVDPPYAGIALVKDTLEREDLVSLAWALYDAWTRDGASAKDQWAFFALGHLGDDEVARALTPKIRAWPTEGASGRAAMGLDVLATIGTDVALMLLSGIADRVKSKPLQKKAKERLLHLAAAKGLTPHQLEDRLVPTLGLDDEGGMELDFGSRAFRVGFDEQLVPFVIGPTGKLADLPKPSAADDKTRAEESVVAWKRLKKDVRALAATQLRRLESAMCASRRWTHEEARAALVLHPLVRHLARRLLFATYDDDGRVTRTVRVAEDGTFADLEDAIVSLPDDATLGIPHRVELDDATVARWSEVFADYELIQPFPQLARDTYAIRDDERGAKELARFAGRSTRSQQLLSLVSRGWSHEGSPDGGVVTSYEKTLDAPGPRATVKVVFEPGIYLGQVAANPSQTIESVTLGGRVETFGALPRIAFSELVRDLEASLRA